jgi:hypothetical protein
MSTETRQSHTLVGWTEMFAGFERNLDQWLARLVELGPEPAPEHAEPIALQGFEERLNRLQTYLDRAEANAEQALAPLTTEIQSMRQWLETLNVARSRFGESWLHLPSSRDEDG